MSGYLRGANLRRALFPAYGQLPAHAPGGSLAEDALELVQLTHHRSSLISQGRGGGPQEIKQRADRDQSVFGRKPLRRRQRLGPFRITRTLLQKQGHRVLVRGEELEQRLHSELFR